MEDYDKLKARKDMLVRKDQERLAQASGSALVRPEFVACMERELQANQRKGDWRLWKPTVLQVLAEIQHHEGKLMLALASGDCERVREHAADIANFAMKVDEQFGGPNGGALSGSARKEEQT